MLQEKIIESAKKRVDEYFYDSEHSLTENQVKHIWSALIEPLVLSKCKEVAEETAYKILEDYNNFLIKWNYTDSDIYAEEPTAIERFLPTWLKTNFPNKEI